MPTADSANAWTRASGQTSRSTPAVSFADKYTAAGRLKTVAAYTSASAQDQAAALKAAFGSAVPEDPTFAQKLTAAYRHKDHRSNGCGPGSLNAEWADRWVAARQRGAAGVDAEMNGPVDVHLDEQEPLPQAPDAAAADVQFDDDMATFLGLQRQRLVDALAQLGDDDSLDEMFAGMAVADKSAPISW